MPFLLAFFDIKLYILFTVLLHVAAQYTARVVNFLEIFNIGGNFSEIFIVREILEPLWISLGICTIMAYNQDTCPLNQNHFSQAVMICYITASDSIPFSNQNSEAPSFGLPEQ